jgi:O-antigen/teichoic acid export membrane protein
MLMLPMIVVFGALGDNLVNLWMGPDFVVPGLSWVLALMAVLHMDRGVTTHVLSGLNSHGRISLICLGTSLVVLVVMLAVLHPLDPLSAGILVAVSSIVGVSIPHYLISCRRLRISYYVHFREVLLKPLLSNSLLLAALLFADDRLGSGDFTAALLATLTGVIVLAALYWNFAFDERLRDTVRRRLKLRLAT